MESDSRRHGERLAWLTLRLIPDLGNRSILRLVDHFGTPSAVLKAGEKDLSSVPGLREKAVLALRARSHSRSADAEWNVMQESGIKLITMEDAEYPANLAEIPDPPSVLFVRGSIEPRDLYAVAVVGSRAASTMGATFTERLCADLAAGGVTIVSGLAVGIDSAAHRGALKGGGRTLAVIGCGLDVDYPRVNTGLKTCIIESGAVISEFPLGTPPLQGNFPRRNRIISGLALGVVVVEAAERSGSLITARLALEQGREVFAVPGIARSLRNVGTHRLLKQGAKLVETAEDVLEEIRPLVRPSWSPAKADTGSRADPDPDVSPEEAELLGHLERAPRHIDDICRSVQWPVARVMAILLQLELKSIVQQLPGKYFMST